MLLFYAFFQKGFSFDTFVKYFSNPAELATIGRSLYIAFIAAIICILIGYPIAYIIARLKNKKLQYILLIAVIAPMWINGLLRTIALQDLAILIGIPNGQGLLITGLVMDYLPFMIMPVYLSLSGISQKFYEASADLGATPRVTFIKVIIPLSMSGIISGFLMVFTPAVSTYYMSAYLGDNSTWMIGEELNLMFTKNHDYSGASVIALVLLFLVGLSIGITNRLSKIGNSKGGII
jgi:spermidine/putrescine transport system permease protein